MGSPSNNISCHTCTEKKSTFLCSSDDHNDENLYSPNNDISAAAIVAVLSPLAVVKNGFISATIRKRNFARTSFHIFLGRLTMTDFLGDLIGGPLHALSILVKAFTDSTLSQDNSTHLSSVREALFFFCHHSYLYHDLDVLSNLDADVSMIL